MKNVLTKRCVLAALLLAPSWSQAGQTIDISQNVSAVTYERHIMPLDEGRIAILWRGANTMIADDPELPGHLATGDCYGVLTMIAGQGLEGGGPCAFTDPDGDRIVIRWWRIPGEPLGHWEATGGTGKWLGATGSGTYRFTNLTRAPEGEFPIPPTGKGLTEWNGAIELP